MDNGHVLPEALPDVGQVLVTMCHGLVMAPLPFI